MMSNHSLPGPPAAQWDDLARRTDSIFATRAWNECWLRHCGPEGTPLVLVDDERAPNVIVPLHRSGHLLKQVRLLGHGAADQLGPVCDAEYRPMAAELIRSAVLDGGGRRCDVLLLHDVPESHRWDRLLGGREIRRAASPIVRFDVDSWEEFLARKSRNFRQQTRRNDRLISSSYASVFRSAEKGTLAQDMRTLFRLHRQTWGKGAPFASGRERRLHEEFAAIAQARGWLRLWLLELDGRTVAALYGFRFADAEYFYQSGRDPEFSQKSVGQVLLAHAVRSALEDGIREYRLLRGDEGYKSRFANADAPVQTLAVANTRKGSAAVKAALRRAR